MGRGVRLACAECDYRADLFERQSRPAGQIAQDEGGDAATAWSSYLCPQCVEAVQLPWRGEDERAEEHTPSCPRCGAALLDFPTAARELADACHSRMMLDLRAEMAGRDHMETLLSRAEALADEVSLGTRSSAEVLADLRTSTASELSTAAARMSALPVEDTTALAGLWAALVPAGDLDACVQLMRARLLQAERHILTLEECVREEEDLPGVPCPRCGTGQLLHWPIWV